MVRVLVPSGALGLGHDPDALDAGIAARPDIIAIDGGSTDSGPHYLGTGRSKYARATTAREWGALMAARARAGVPLVIGSAETCGTDRAVDRLVEITREIAAERGEALRIAVLRCTQDPDDLVRALAAGRIHPLDPAPGISAERLRQCSNIVALAGAEQIQAALATGAQIVIAGRTTDTAIISALPLLRGCDPGAAWHGAKIGECGALCTTRPDSGVIMLTFERNGFTVTPMARDAAATPFSVSAHMLYENADPFILHEPGGHLDVSAARYEALDERRVRASGAIWVPAQRYTVKLEGARPTGFRVASLVLIRAPRHVAAAAAWCRDIERRARADVCARLGLARDSFDIELRRIGQDATLGALERRRGDPVELGVLAIVSARDAAAAGEIARLLNPYLLHHPLPADEAQPSLAFAFSPPEMALGPAHEFCLNHVLELEQPMQAFRLEVIEVGHGQAG